MTARDRFKLYDRVKWSEELLRDPVGPLLPRRSRHGPGVQS